MPTYANERRMHNTSLAAHAVTSEYAIARRTDGVQAAATVATAGNKITEQACL